MTSKQLAERIGNVDEELVQSTQGTPGSRRHRGRNIISRVLALAAALALAVSTFAIGALAFSKETIVEVPAHQETVRLEGLGLTLILPNSWKDRYIAKVSDDGRGVEVFCRAVYDSDTEWNGAGSLFWIGVLPELFTAQDFEEESPVPGRYLFATETFTCVLYVASDVQYPLEDEALSEEYLQMSQDAHLELQIIIENFCL